ncbi:hypothetical protein Tco_1190090 [Tanacetum coccineum]
MANLKFGDTPNMVAFLSKPAESEGFKKIMDFLNANPIRYALTINPTIYISCIEQFWSIVKAKTVNGEVQLQALVDGKKIIITESTMRRDLRLEDAKGVDCLPNATIFEQLALMGYEQVSQKLTFYKAFLSPQWKFLIHKILQCLSAKTTAWNEFSSTMASAIICLATNQKFNFSKYIFDSMVKNLENVSEDFWKHEKGKERFSGRETPLFQTMVVQEQAEMGEGSVNPTDPHHTPTIIQPSPQPQNKQKPRKPKRNDTQIVTPPKSDLQRNALKSAKVQEKGDVIEDPSVPVITVSASTKDSAATITTATRSKELFFKSQDKGKRKMVEPEKPMKKKELIRLVEEIASKLQAEFDEEVRLAREKAKKEQEANVALTEEWDNIQAKIKADHELRKHFAAKRAEEKRNKPPTQAQQRKIMCTSLKNMEGKKPKDLKNKSFDSIQKMFDRAFKRVNTFVDFRTDWVEGSSKRVGTELE